MKLLKIDDSNILEHYERINKKLLAYGYKVVDKIVSNEHIRFLYKNFIVNDNKIYQSIYVKENYRNMRIFNAYKNEYQLITLKECNIPDYVINNYFIVNKDDRYKYLSFIEMVYGDTKAKRTRIPYINHIYEGLAIINKLFCSPSPAADAFCIHPIVQDEANKFLYREQLKEISSIVIENVELYACIANLHLRENYKQRSNISLNLLSNLVHVKNMLIADKIQNYKDAYNNRDNLSEWEDIEDYFFWWFDILGINCTTLKECFRLIS